MEFAFRIKYLILLEFNYDWNFLKNYAFIMNM